MRDDLVQRLADAMEGGYSMNGDGLLHNLARAVLASGLVVPTSDVLGLAQQWEDGWGIDTSAHWRDSEDCAAELRALTQQEPR